MADSTITLTAGMQIIVRDLADAPEFSGPTQPTETSLPSGAVTLTSSKDYRGTMSANMTVDFTLPDGVEVVMAVTGAGHVYTVNGNAITTDPTKVSLIGVKNFGGQIVVINNGEAYSGGFILPTPATPTGGVVDDNADTFAFTLATGYTLAQHEMTTNGGNTWQPATNPISVGNSAIAANMVGVRVAESPTNNPSEILWNSDPFTATTPAGQLPVLTVNKVTRTQSSWWVFFTMPAGADKMFLVAGASVNPVYEDVGSDVSNYVNQGVIEINDSYNEIGLRVTDSTNTLQPSDWIKLTRPATFSTLGDTTLTDNQAEQRVYASFPPNTRNVNIKKDGVIAQQVGEPPYNYYYYGGLTSGTYDFTAETVATGYEPGGSNTLTITIP